MTVAPPQSPAPLPPTVRGELLGIVGWIAAAAVAMLLAIVGLSVALLTGHTIGRMRPEDLGMSTRQFERVGVNICGDPVGSEVIFWLRNGDVIQLGGGLLAAVAALAFFVLVLLGRRRLAAAVLVVGVLAVIVPLTVGHQLDREFWHGSPPDFSRGGWSSACDPN
jgi:amino acid transporter